MASERQLPESLSTKPVILPDTYDELTRAVEQLTAQVERLQQEAEAFRTQLLVPDRFVVSVGLAGGVVTVPETAPAVNRQETSNLQCHGPGHWRLLETLFMHPQLSPQVGANSGGPLRALTIAGHWGSGDTVARRYLGSDLYCHITDIETMDDGETRQCWRYTPDCPWVCKCEAAVRRGVCDGCRSWFGPLTSEVILGVDFLQKEHASIDLSDVWLHLKERGCNVSLRAPASLLERGDSHLVN